MSNIKISYIQTNLYWEDSKKNLDNISLKINAITEKTDVIVLPEMFNSGFSMNPAAFAETMDGETVEWMLHIAKTRDVLIMGSICIKEEGKYYNRLLVVFPDSKILHYNKKHLFRHGGENEFFEAGTEKLIFEYKSWKIFPLICYDLRFPLWSRNSYKNKQIEYDVMIYVANWPEKRSYAWKHLLIARAIENQAFVLGVNRVGVDGKQTEHSGNSILTDARGITIYESPANMEEVITLELDKERLLKWRKHFMPVLDWDNY